MIRTLAALSAALAPAAAFAHGGPAGHAHPHGLEIALLGAVAAVVLFGAARAARKIRK